MSLALNLDSSHDDVCGGVGETVSRSLALSPCCSVALFSLSLSPTHSLSLSVCISLPPTSTQTHIHNDLEMHMGWLREVGSLK